MEDIIIIKDFNIENLFKNMTINIKKNKFITISGPNNCGKTTFFRILNREIITDNKINIKGIDINDYSIENFSNLVQCIIPLEISFEESTLEEELYTYNNDNDEVEKIIKGLKIKKILTKEIKKFNTKEIVLSQLALALIKNPEILLIDDIGQYLEEKETSEILKYLIQYKKEHDITILYATINLKESLLTDYLYIIKEGKVNLEGLPIEVLEKDNQVNKIGLELPFMIDLSVKLKDYELIDSIELEMNRMVEKIWK